MNGNLSPRQFGEQLSLFPEPARVEKPPALALSKPPPVHDAMNKHGVYIRFGDWPKDERSLNHAQGGKEEGVSVYHMQGPHAEPEDPDPHGSRYDYDVEGHREMHIDTHGTDEGFDPEDYGDAIRSNDTGAEMRGRRMSAYRDATWDGRSFYGHEEQKPAFRGHFVKGDLVGSGHDDEPLLHNVRNVGQWPQHAHRFVPGTQSQLFSDREAQGKKSIWQMSPEELRSERRGTA